VVVGSVGSVVVAWGITQWDYLLPTTLTVSAAAAPRKDHRGAGSDRARRRTYSAFGLLYVLDQKTLLPEKSMPEPTSRPTGG